MSLKPVPERISSIFNSNYFFQDGSYLQNSGNQFLDGSLRLKKETVYGPEYVYGDSYVQSEPTVISVTDANSLQSNQLVSKSYVDAKISIYPQIYTYGESYDLTGAPPVISSGLIYVNFPPTKIVNLVYLKVTYKMTYAFKNSVTSNIGDTFFDSYYVIKTIVISGVLQVFVRWVTGEELRNQIVSTTFNQNFTPLTIGSFNNRLSLIYGFPSNKQAFVNGIDKNIWISSYGITFNILESTEEVVNNLSSTNNGSAWFSVS